jgi:fibronectin type 3 domain-containing protein
VNFTATANTTHTVLLSVTDTDTGVGGYRYYRSTTSGSSYALLNTSLAGNSYTDSTVVAGQNYYYVATAVNANGESGYSPEATSGVIP